MVTYLLSECKCILGQLEEEEEEQQTVTVMCSKQQV